MIAIIDYGVGNVRAFANIYKRMNVPVKLAKTADDMTDATHIILPGVGAFDWAMTKLNESGMRETLEHLVRRDKRPVLGICVGMQMMARGSDEGRERGLGWFDAEVKLFDDACFRGSTHLPHMGWNDVTAVRTAGLFRELSENARFYFLHSYYFSAINAADISGKTVYGESFASAVERGNVYGVQFHPEKSHKFGIQLLKNFAEL